MDPFTRKPDPGPDELPRLADALRRLEQPPFAASSQMDEHLCASISAHFASRRKTVRRWPFAAAAALAAVLLISVVLPAIWNSAPAPAVQIVGDVDSNGRVNIVDAYLLARDLVVAERGRAVMFLAISPAMVALTMRM